MTETQHKQWMTERIERLKTLRDEIRLDLHLAEMEAKDRWRQMEPKLREVEQLAEDVSEASRRAVEDLVDRFKSFRQSLKRNGGSGPQILN